MINIAILGTGKIIPEAVEGLQTSKKFNVDLIFARPQESLMIMRYVQFSWKHYAEDLLRMLKMMVSMRKLFLTKNIQKGVDNLIMICYNSIIK